MRSEADFKPYAGLRLLATRALRSPIPVFVIDERFSIRTAPALSINGHSRPASEACRDVSGIAQNPVAGITRSASEIPEVLVRIPVALTAMAGSFQIKSFRFAGRVVLTGKREFGEACLILMMSQIRSCARNCRR
jgi:hypothetical protein